MWQTGMLRFLEILPQRTQLVVANYHRIGNRSDTDFDPEVFSIDQDGLGEQVRFLKKNYDLITPADALDVILGKVKPRGTCVLLTFDDGYLDNLTLGVPALKAHGASAVFFLVTSYLQDPYQLPWWDLVSWLTRKCAGKRLVVTQPTRYEITVTDHNIDSVIREMLRRCRSNIDLDLMIAEMEASANVPAASARGAERLLMSWDDSRKLMQEGMTIGLHTHSHTILSKLDAAGQAREFSTCQQRLKETLGIEADMLAYPVGCNWAFSGISKKCAKDAGFKAAFSFYGGTNTIGAIDPFDVRRIAFPEYATVARTRAAAATLATTQRIWL